MRHAGSARRRLGRRLAWAALLGPVVSVSLLLGVTASADQTAPKRITCLEKLPPGAKRPTLKETFPGEAIAGYEAPLGLEIRHGKGETPLASGFRVSAGSDVAKALEEAGFLVGEADGGGALQLKTVDDGDEAVTTVTLPIVVAPTKSGKRSLTLPQLPINVSRANGDTMTVCTQLHLITAIDPTSGEEDPKPHPNPDPRAQREDWPLMKWILAGAVLLFLLLLLVGWWVRKQMQKPVPDATPERRLPWEEALEELAALRTSPMLDDRLGAQREHDRAELYDRVSDCVRKYMGARYGFEGLGFDGLETTTDEMMTLLSRVRPGVPRIDLVQTFLSDCDLVKFARVVPGVTECNQALERAEVIVRATIPAPRSDGLPNAAPPPGALATPAAAAAPPRPELSEAPPPPPPPVPAPAPAAEAPVPADESAATSASATAPANEGAPPADESERAP